MKLSWSSTSPYARKVLMCAMELGLSDKIECVAIVPVGPDSAAVQYNPLGKIPALELENGMVIFDSPVICEYLDSLSDERTLIPPKGAARWKTLTAQALADEAVNAGVLIMMERARPENERSSAWVGRQNKARNQALDKMNHVVADLGETVSIAHLSFCAALGWFDFRFADEDWRPGRDRLAAWYENFSTHPTAVKTVPKMPAA